jgi:hypothetical protein
LLSEAKPRWAWFYGLKIHAIINSKGELICLKLTPGNVDDRKPMPELCQGLFGQLFADKGYLSKELTENLARSPAHHAAQEEYEVRAPHRL